MKRRSLLQGLALATIATHARGESHMSLSADPKDILAVTAEINRYRDAWNAADLTAMGQLYMPSIHWINVRGMHWRGFEEVDRAHRVYFDIMFRGVQQDLLEIESITPVTGDVMVAVVLWRMGAFTTPDGHKLPPGRTRMTMVYTRTGAGWRIAHGHNEDVAEDAQQFDPIRGTAMKR